MNDDFERLQLQTKKKYVLDTFRNGLRRIQDDSKVAQKFVFLCLALAVVALFFASGSSGNDVLSVVFRPIIYAVYAIAWLAECIGVIFVFGYLPHSWAYYDDFTRAGIRTSSKTIRNNSIYGTKSSVTNGTGSPSPVSKFRLSTNWPPIIKLTPKR